jgi:hypothetical protein
MMRGNKVNDLRNRALKRGVTGLCWLDRWCMTIHSSEYMYAIQG